MMTAVLAKRALLSAALVVMASGCSDSGRADLPAVPRLAEEDFSPDARDEAGRRLEAVRAAPDDPRVNGELGMFLHARERFDAAKVFYRRAAALSGGNVDWTYLLGVVEQRDGAYEQAAEAFRATLARRASAPAAIRLGEVLESLQRRREAREAFEDALQIDRNAPAAFYALGRALLDLGETKQAIALLEKAVALSPQDGAAFYSLGLAYRGIGDEASAKRYLQLSQRRPRTKPPIRDPILAKVEELSADRHYYLNLGRRLEAGGQREKAIEAYQKALALDPGMAAAHANLVGAYGRRGEFGKAEAHYRAALASDPNLEELHNNWGVVQAMQENPAAAADAFRKALGLNPQSAEAHANLGTALLQMGEGKAAAAHFESALSNDPAHRVSRLHLGRHALGAGRFADAIEHLEKALEGPPNDRLMPFVLQTLAETYRRAGMERQAVETARRALDAAEALGMTDLAAQIRREAQSASGP